MSALGVVEALQVAEDAGLGLLVGLVISVFDLLGFQTGEETLHHCVVITVALTRHALADTVGIQHSPKPGAGILGEFNRSSQHLDGGEVWDVRWVGLRLRLEGRRCGRHRLCYKSPPLVL